MTDEAPNPDLFVQFLIDTSTIEQLASRIRILHQEDFDKQEIIFNLKKKIKEQEKEIILLCL